MNRGIKSSTHLSAKGQVVIPKAIRDACGWRTGIELEVEATEGTVVLRPKSLGRVRAAESLLGCTGYRGPTRSVAEMDGKRGAKARR